MPLLSDDFTQALRHSMVEDKQGRLGLVMRIIVVFLQWKILLTLHIRK